MAEARVAGGGCCPPMDLFRSEAMQLVQLIIPIESAHHTVSYIGDLGLIQFKDVRTHSSLSFFVSISPYLPLIDAELIVHLSNWISYLLTIVFRAAGNLSYL
jgi:hypothetical protein